MAKRRRHPNKHIEAALRYAEGCGWEVITGGSHAWGFLYCPHARRGGCQVPIYSTPRGPENFAKRLRAKVDKCPHQGRN